MCGIAGALNLKRDRIPDLERRLRVMNETQRHRGPDGEGTWTHHREHVGFAHRRLSIIDLTTGDQPMTTPWGDWIVYNGEIYNYPELRNELNPLNFVTRSDTEVILHAYHRWGVQCATHLRGMFSFALWDEQRQTLVCARDRCGIKPFYYHQAGDVLYFASEVKTLLPFVDAIETDVRGFEDYLTFQFCLGGKTMFKGIHELPPGHMLVVRDGAMEIQRYWQVYYELDFDHTPKYFEEQIRQVLFDSINIHLRSDVPVGAYVSGGLDSSIVASLACLETSSKDEMLGFTGKFALGEAYDESAYARELAQWHKFQLHEIDIQPQDFIDHIRKVIYHLDYPVAGPGAFPQYMVSQLASRYRKVVLGGQGGDEIFGGYVRYLVAYFEQCIKAAIEGTSHSGNFVVTYESIIPNLVALKSYKPMVKEFWREGLFEERDKRYFRLVNRNNYKDEIRWELLADYSPFESFKKVFWGDNVKPESYFDSMTHFDFKTLLPALLQVEDRMSMAHGLESRVPILDHRLVELAATIPSDTKFKDGTMKNVLREAMRAYLPPAVCDRKNKMGFPVPLTEWMAGPVKDFVYDIFTSRRAQERELIDNEKVLESMSRETQFGRRIWGLLCLELWQQEFHDKEADYKKKMDTCEVATL